MVQSLRDVVYVEFYDVLDEKDFDPKVKQPMSNLRLLSHKTFEVKDLPFDKEDYVDSFSLLMPIDYSKKVAEFKFRAQFQRAVAAEFIARNMEPGTGYMLSSRVIFEKEFAINHDKCLDKANIACKFRNVTNETLPVQNTRLFFNKEVLPLGQVFIRVGDQIEMTFTV